MGLFGFGSDDKDQESYTHGRVAANIVIRTGLRETLDQEDFVREGAKDLGLEVDIHKYARVCAGTFSELVLLSFESTEGLVYEDAKEGFLYELTEDCKEYFSEDYSFESGLGQEDKLKTEWSIRAAGKYFDRDLTEDHVRLFGMAANKVVNWTSSMREDYPL